jgi:formylglycine-generating enzyme required for sulfatase activity
MAELAAALQDYLQGHPERFPDTTGAKVALAAGAAAPPAPAPPTPPPPARAKTPPGGAAWPAPPGRAPAGPPPGGAAADPQLPCPRCGRPLRLPPALWGKRARCPRCSGELRVPENPLGPSTVTDVRAAVRETPPPGPVSVVPLPHEFVNPVGMRLVWVPPGTFLMGSPPGEEGRGDDETAHRVTLTRGFYLGAGPVTQAQWRAVMGPDPSRFRGDDRPVENVCWYDCQQFCRQLSRLDRRRYRLPTEAEWEYACRAGTTTPFFFGETLTTDQANFDGNYAYGAGPRGKNRKETTPVGTFPPNAWGLFDLHGNVWEWCSDRHAPFTAADAVDPTGGDAGDERVLRGGSWVYGPRACRSACRFRNEPDYHAPDLGFRVCFCPD